MRQRRLLLYDRGIVMNLYSKFFKVSVNSNRLFVLLEPHKFLSVPVSTTDYDNLFLNSCIRLGLFLNEGESMYEIDPLLLLLLVQLFILLSFMLQDFGG